MSQYFLLFLLLCHTEIITYYSDVSICFAVPSIVLHWNYYLQFRYLNIFCCSFYCVTLKLLLTIQMSQYFLLFLLLCHTEIISYYSDVSICFAVPSIVLHWNYYLLFRCLNIFCCSSIVLHWNYYLQFSCLNIFGCSFYCVTVSRSKSCYYL
jgi:hypothetical protein